MDIFQMELKWRNINKTEKSKVGAILRAQKPQVLERC